MAIRISVSEDLKNSIQTRVKEIGVSSMAEYIRILVNLDLMTQDYQHLSYLIKKSEDEISQLQEQLRIFATPLQ